MYQSVKTTLDGEWQEDELRENVYDVCIATMTPRFLEMYKYRALKNADLLLWQYMAEHILNQIGDVVELYNEEHNKHLEDNCNGIEWYDKRITSIIHRELEENLVK